MPGLIGVEIRAYKNLKELWLPWSEGLAVLGKNGVGKTNLIEALTVLFGSQLTVDLAMERLVAVGPDQLAFIAEVSADELPLPPALFAGMDWTSHEPEGGPVDEFFYDWQWWSHVGVADGEDLFGGLGRLSLPSAVARYVSAQLE